MMPPGFLGARPRCLVPALMVHSCTIPRGCFNFRRVVRVPGPAQVIWIGHCVTFIDGANPCLRNHHSGARIVGPISCGPGRPGAGGCGSFTGGSKFPQSVRARICSTVVAVTKLLSSRICHPKHHGEAERDIGQCAGEAALRLKKILLRGQHGGK